METTHFRFFFRKYRIEKLQIKLVCTRAWYVTDDVFHQIHLQIWWRSCVPLLQMSSELVVLNFQNLHSYFVDGVDGVTSILKSRLVNILPVVQMSFKQVAYWLVHIQWW